MCAQTAQSCYVADINLSAELSVNHANHWLTISLEM